MQTENKQATPIVAVVGASGFVGSRMVEMFHLTGRLKIRAVVRSFSGLAHLSKFSGIEWRIADVNQENALQAAFTGCEVVVSCVMGENIIPEKSAAATYAAAARAGVRRIIYISSAVVHGATPESGSDEASVIVPSSLNDYARGKALAEKTLLGLSRKGGPDVVILRPSIIYGPRSPWVVGPAGSLVHGTAALVQGGNGICNLVYVDNLVHAIELAATSREGGNQIFLINDEPVVTWRQYYEALASELGIKSVIADVPLPPAHRPSLIQKYNAMAHWKFFSGLKKYIPKIFKSIIRGVIEASGSTSGNEWSPPQKLHESISTDLAFLHINRWVMTTDRIRKVFGYSPKVTYPIAISRSINWLKDSGCLE